MASCSGCELAGRVAADALVVAALLYHLGGRARTRAAPGWRSSASTPGSRARARDLLADRGLRRPLFWVHMVQHVLLTDGGAARCFCSAARGRGCHGRSRSTCADRRARRARRRDARARAGAPASGLGRRCRRSRSSTATLLAWHLPALYDLTLRNGLVHDLEHALFFGTALLFWRHLAPSAPSAPRCRTPARRVRHRRDARRLAARGRARASRRTPLYSALCRPVQAGRSASRRSPTSSSRPG